MSDTQVSFGDFWDGVLSNDAVRGLPDHATLSPRAVTFAETLLESDSAKVTVAPPTSSEAKTWSEPPTPNEAPSPPAARDPGTPSPRSEGEIEILTQLGEGGMGVVHRARQRSLERDVAVKMLHSGADASLVEALLQEARITGSLEHPNVIPIHDLRLIEGSEPQLVMKRIEGHTWTELLEDTGHVAWRETARWSGDPLRNNLEILLEVCNAVHFAHSRGTLHRDLKPDNVMVGSFGEVYVMDWGLAAPAADDTYVPGGSPPYMAPEMLDGLATERTDVYLLGAILHELLTGTRRHRGGSRLRILLSVLESSPVDYEASVPSELADICNRATAFDPEERFASVLMFRKALTEYVQHRGSVDLADVAAALLAELHRDLETGADPPNADRRFAECRFGFRQALRDWPENAAARNGLRSCLDALVECELRRGNGRAAAAALAERREFDPEPRVALDVLESRVGARRRETEQLKRLATDLDPMVSARARTRFFLVMLGIMFPFMITMFTLLQSGLVGRENAILLALPILGALVFGAAFVVGRKTLMANVFNRRIMLTFMSLIGGIFLHRVVANNLGHTFEEILNVDMVLMSLVAAVGALSISRQLLVLAAILGAGAIWGSLTPEHALPILVSTFALTGVACGVLLFRLRPPEDAGV